MHENSDFEELKQYLNSQESVDAAILFGSAVSKYFQADSDIDIALLSKQSISAEELFELRHALENICKRSVDLIVITSNSSCILTNEIARKGKLLFTKDEKLSDNFFIKAPQMYEDLMVTRRGIEDAYITRKLHD